jgi:hypothetical protein
MFRELTFEQYEKTLCDEAGAPLLHSAALSHCKEGVSSFPFLRADLSQTEKGAVAARIDTYTERV